MLSWTSRLLVKSHDILSADGSIRLEVEPLNTSQLQGIRRAGGQGAIIWGGHIKFNCNERDHPEGRKTTAIQSLYSVGEYKGHTSVKYYFHPPDNELLMEVDMSHPQCPTIPFHNTSVSFSSRKMSWKKCSNYIKT